MAPPDGTRVPRIPTLSWDSVVDSPDDSAPSPQPAAPAATPPNPAPPANPGPQAHAAPPAPPVRPAPAATDSQPIGFEPLHLDPLSLDPVRSDPVSPVRPDPVSFRPVRSDPVSPVSPVSPDPVSPDPVTSDPLGLDPVNPDGPMPPPATSTPPPPTPESQVVAPSDPAPDEGAAIRTTPPAVVVPAIGDVTSGAEVVAPVPAAEPLPEIREATPVTESAGPALPSIPLPVQQAAPSPHSAFEFDAASVVGAPTPQPRRSASRRGLKLLATLVVLGGVVAAAVVFGQPYLFPGDWDAAAEPYADAVESASGVEFVEPLSVNAEPTAEFAVTLQQQLASTSPAQLAEWRPLGLSSGVVDDATLAAQLTGWQDAVYSTDDGQVYHDLGAAGPDLDAQLVQAMAAASLDQEYGWSVEQAQRTLDGAAATSGEVLRQAREIQAGSTFGGEVTPVPTSQVDALPPVIGYRVIAPQVFAEFAGENDPNPLRGLGPAGPGPLGDELPAVSGDPLMLDGDTVVGTPVARDRSFWFLVFGGLLDGPTAFAASEAIVENSVTLAARGETECVYATFSGGGVEQTDTLRSALGAWVAAAPAEMASSFTALPDGSLQLSSCDPGVEFPGAARIGVVAELVAYRSLELATAAAVASKGGGQPEFDYMWSLIGSSNMPGDIAAVAVEATPSEIAAASTDAVEALYSLAG